MGIAPIFRFWDGNNVAQEKTPDFDANQHIIGQAPSPMEVRLAQTIRGLGFELIDLQRINHGQLLRIFIDGPNGVGIKDCETVTHHLLRWLEVEAVPFDRLEVSSPGVDRPLKTPSDFAKWMGESVHIKLSDLWQARKNWQGKLTGLTPDAILLEVEANSFAVPLDLAQSVRLLPNYQELLKKKKK